MSAGLLGQWGFKSESAWGTKVVVDKFHQGYLSGVPARNQPPLMSKGIRANRRFPTCLEVGPKDVKGTVKLELAPTPMSTLLRHMHGTIATTGSGPYVHTASLGTLKGQSITGQWGVPGTGLSTPAALTFFGVKFPKWSITAKAGEIAQLSLDMVAKDYDDTTTLAAASYGTDCPFTFVNGSVSVAGTQVSTVKNVTLDVTRPLRSGKDGTYLGSALISEQLETGQATATIKVDNEFEDLTIHDLANTAVAVVLNFTAGANSLVMTTNAWIEAFTPSIDGVDSLTSSSFQADCFGSSDAAALQSVLTNTEATDT